jgi:hypothetical protein
MASLFDLLDTKKLANDIGNKCFPESKVHAAKSLRQLRGVEQKRESVILYII